LANAARGQSVLWIIGADEKANRVVGADGIDLASWPEPQDLVVTFDGTPVVALLFTTDRAPYVVRNPDFGRVAGNIEREVPWRAQTAVRSAKREDLIRILIPVLSSPTIEVRSASAMVDIINREAEPPGNGAPI
jgi:hypothetical protein